LFADGLFHHYAYGYPHKTAYRPFEPKPLLADLWRDEDKHALFLYLHVPFCEMRCGFCNLFTSVRPGAPLAQGWVSTLEREAEQVKEALGPSARFARLALGGGTPTQLELPLLERVLAVARRLGADPRQIPSGIETSPETAHPEKLALLREQGVQRVSIGVQSFFDEELRALGRPQREADVDRALGALRAAGFPVLNVDLIYGMAGQTEASLCASIDRALEVRPEELYLYPLYVRPLTGLGRRGAQTFDEHRASLYRAGHAHLLERGYEQVSMRMFRRSDQERTDGPVYCCQTDGMVGLGPGARSYTRAVHYSSDFAVNAGEVREIIARYVEWSDDELRRAHFGFRLDVAEQMRRFVIQSLLSDEGLSTDAFARRFEREAVPLFPELAELVSHGLARAEPQAFHLTAEGFAASDAIGPWLYSAAVKQRMQEYEAR
jgi:oxygen-independent coproporphyrinogen-3 oxidase